MKSTIEPRYFEEVLGITLFPNRVGKSIEKVPVTVECEDLTEFTKPLLDKILGSVGVKKWSQMDIGGTEVPSHHRFRFVGTGGCHAVGETVHWLLPTLSQMLGDGPHVATHKKAAWALLQQFQRESGRGG